MASSTSSPQNLPILSATAGSEDVAPGEEDPSEVTKLFLERLQAWKYACGYLEDYVSATQKLYEMQSKEYEKTLKIVNQHLKEGHQFDQGMGGIAELFDSLRSNTQILGNSHAETAKSLKSTALPFFDRLQTEIKNKTKELNKGVGSASKSVDKARTTTQKHIERLGQHTSSYDVGFGAKADAANDPYILAKGVRHRLNKQLQEEANTRQDMLTVQNTFSHFESHVVQTFQEGIGQLTQIVTQQTEETRSLYGSMAATGKRLDPLAEWNAFVKRNTGVLIDPNIAQRKLADMSFVGEAHAATQPLIQGALERKSGLTRSYSTAFYAVTAAKFLHELKTDDDLARDPAPDISLYLPECIVGACAVTEFAVKGKDVSKGKLGVGKVATAREFSFRARTPKDAETWWGIISGLAKGEIADKEDSQGGWMSKMKAGKKEDESVVTPVQESAVASPETRTTDGSGNGGGGGGGGGAAAAATSPTTPAMEAGATAVPASHASAAAAEAPAASPTTGEREQ